MSLHVKSTTVFSTLFLSLLIPAWAEPPSEAAMLANACAACHGPQGSSQGPATPSIAGISADYFIDTMEAFKENEHPATVMNRIARGYSEQQIELMAKYFASQPMIVTAQPFDSALAKKGAVLHKTHCEKCHEHGGRASADNPTILAGQKTPYLRYTMQDIVAGKREVPVKMQKILEKVHSQAGVAGIEQLLNFYASEK